MWKDCVHPPRFQVVSLLEIDIIQGIRIRPTSLDGKTRAPREWKETYKGATYEVFTKDNFLNFIS